MAAVATPDAFPEPPNCAGVAANHVFGITELLEAILLDVPFKTLLTSQRVNKQWKGTVRGSRTLQKKLFLTPAEARYALSQDYFQEKNERGFPSSRELPFEPVPANFRQCQYNYIVRATLNPVLGRLQIPNTFQQRVVDGEEVNFETSIIHSHIAYPDRDLSRYWHPSATHNSYLDMFVCQPPCKAVLVQYFGYTRVIKREETGVRLGDVLTACNSIRARIGEGFVQMAEQRYGFRKWIGDPVVQFPGFGNALWGPKVLFEPSRHRWEGGGSALAGRIERGEVVSRNHFTS